jgi:hypothetical protein
MDPKTANATPMAISIWASVLQPDHRPDCDSKAKTPKAARPLPKTIKEIAIFFMSLSVREVLAIPAPPFNSPAAQTVVSFHI